MKRPRPKPDPDSADGDGARACAVQLLARREHSSLELRRKLADRGFPQQVIEQVLAGLAAEGLQSDGRFAEQYVRSRAQRGFGPVRIAAELRERGIADPLAREQLADGQWDWAARAERERRKRFGAGLPRDWKEQARQARFLQTRGFGREHMAVLFGAESLD